MSNDSPAALDAANRNGSGEPDRLFADDGIEGMVEAKVAQHRARLDDLDAERTRVLGEVRRYEKALAVLRGEKLSQGGGTPKRPAKQYARMSDERREIIWNAILAWEDEEFRQIDIAGLTGISSSVMTAAFMQLREEGKIRLGRVATPAEQGGKGGGKYFRLTREALRERDER